MIIFSDHSKFKMKLYNISYKQAVWMIGHAEPTIGKNLPYVFASEPLFLKYGAIIFVIDQIQDKPTLVTVYDNTSYPEIW